MIKYVKEFIIFGLSKQLVSNRLFYLKKIFPKIGLSVRRDFPFIHVYLFSKTKNVYDIVHKEFDSIIFWIVNSFGKYILTDNILSFGKIIGVLLKNKRVTLSLAESCTGGVIANYLTKISGISDFFLYSVVTYSNSSKNSFLNISNERIEIYGAVSEKIAELMAKNVKELSKSDYAIATSGVSGPTGGSKFKPVGTLYVGIAGPFGSYAVRFYIPSDKRFINKINFAVIALYLLKKELLNL